MKWPTRKPNLPSGTQWPAMKRGESRKPWRFARMDRLLGFQWRRAGCPRESFQPLNRRNANRDRVTRHQPRPNCRGWWRVDPLQCLEQQLQPKLNNAGADARAGDDARRPVRNIRQGRLRTATSALADGTEL